MYFYKSLPTICRATPTCNDTPPLMRHINLSPFVPRSAYRTRDARVFSVDTRILGLKKRNSTSEIRAVYMYIYIHTHMLYILNFLFNFLFNIRYKKFFKIKIVSWPSHSEVARAVIYARKKLQVHISLKNVCVYRKINASFILLKR